MFLDGFVFFVPPQGPPGQKFKVFCRGGLCPLSGLNFKLFCFCFRGAYVPPGSNFEFLLVGAYDGAQSADDAAVKHLTREAKGFQLKELGAGSHFVPMEHPDLVLKAIREFID